MAESRTAMGDLYGRLLKARYELRDMAANLPRGAENARLLAKAEGVDLAAGYVAEAMSAAVTNGG